MSCFAGRHVGPTTTVAPPFSIEGTKQHDLRELKNTPKHINLLSKIEALEAMRVQ
jgi:hypothetical protein